MPYIKINGQWTNVSEFALKEYAKKTDLATKLSLPTDDSGNPNYGTVGYYAVSDGAGGITWVASGNTGGDTGGGETTTHGIVWDLVNVTSSNPVVSVADGASLVAVLTAADGYTLGDVTITMGGEIVTGAWNADTATVTIPSVTGNVMISCAGVAESSGEVVDTTAVIEVSGKGITSAGRVYANENWGYTKFYEINDTSITLYGTNTEGVGGPTSNAIFTVLLDTDDGTTPFTVIGSANPLNSMNVGKEILKEIPDGATGLRATILLAEIDNYYCYETNTGKVIYAGANTPYYGLTNVNNASATVDTSSVDDDIAQDYSVAVTSILGEGIAENPSSAYGLDSDFATAIDTARTAWMTEYGSDYRKIPVIITTDQHAHKKSGIFNMLGSVLNMYDVSKIMNLGDTISVEWYDDDAKYPLRTNATLDAWMESIKAIPFSKRLDVYGNHDTWYGNYADDGNTVGTRYPSSQAHLYQYFRNIYARRTNNNGWFVVHDDMFNVKYVVVSGFEYNGGVGFRIGTKQMQFIIDELGKNDGYDIVIVSHVPLYYQDSTNIWPTGMESSTPDSTSIMRVAAIDTDALFNARKNKTSGTVTDSDGIEHSFDFSDCTSDILCSLHGHTHIDAYNYVGGSDDGLASVTFDWFGNYAVHFVLIDRVNRRLNVWKTDSSYEVLNYQVPFDKVTE